MPFNVVKFMVLVDSIAHIIMFSYHGSSNSFISALILENNITKLIVTLLNPLTRNKNQKIIISNLFSTKKIFLTLSDCGPNMGRPWSGRSPIVVRSRFDHGQTMVRSWSDHGLAETEIEFGDECFLNHLKSSARSRDILI